MTKATEEAVVALDRLMGHFQVQEDDTPDVREYKESIVNGLSCLGQDMHKLDEVVHIHPGDTCTHYKGGQYHYLGLATQESDGTPLALYRSMESGILYARPASEFFGVVVVEEDGQESHLRYRKVE
ncbi:DUF1653 domain-containing protein [Acidithiobacillus thiooxidans]|uniref:DUF1653 domain-containing protein n=1 Tax=Acidithiobacillus thiooxidans TaxID=930 RepID=UPI001C079D7A|nr:DUF1653 domain-containing protein [Acidithiobacillus thiooxidans]